MCDMTEMHTSKSSFIMSFCSSVYTWTGATTVPGSGLVRTSVVELGVVAAGAMVEKQAEEVLGN